jgi:DNA-binding winged helix-turn-helix (wHTH) protein
MNTAPQRGISVDWKQQRIAVDDVPVRLTPMEWKLLERLAWAPGQLVSHQQLFKHLYGKERDCRAQATAVRVLINKLRRLLPIRIEAQWGHGYVIEGVPASQGGDPEDDGPKGRPEDNRQKPDAPATRSSTIIVRPAPMACNSQPLGRRLITTKQAGRRRGVALPVTDSQGRATELSVIERFLAERGVTHCPDPRTIAMSGQSELVWDKMKRKWVRSAAQEIAAPAVG